MIPHRSLIAVRIFPYDYFWGQDSEILVVLFWETVVEISWKDQLFCSICWRLKTMWLKYLDKSKSKIKAVGFVYLRKSLVCMYCICVLYVCTIDVSGHAVQIISDVFCSSNAKSSKCICSYHISYHTILYHRSYHIIHLAHVSKDYPDVQNWLTITLEQSYEVFIMFIPHLLVMFV